MSGARILGKSPSGCRRTANRRGMRRVFGVERRPALSQDGLNQFLSGHGVTLAVLLHGLPTRFEYRDDSCAFKRQGRCIRI